VVHRTVLITIHLVLQTVIIVDMFFVEGVGEAAQVVVKTAEAHSSAFYVKV